MKAIKSIVPILFLALITWTFIGWTGSEKESAVDVNPNTIVLLKFKAQPEKSDQVVSELNVLLEQVKKEPNFVSIKLHVDPNDESNVLLYEEWEDVDYYNNKHMKTAHLQAFMTNSNNFLAGPPEITFWKVHEVLRIKGLTSSGWRSLNRRKPIL